MNRRDLLRTTLFGAIGASTTVPFVNAREFPPGYDASKELKRADWKPAFMDEHQNNTLIVFSEFIIPATDTPGAKDALVNRFLDLLMTIETQETQRAFLGALAYIDGACMERYRSAFLHATHEQQAEFLNLIAYPHSHSTWGEEAEEFPGHSHFQKLKDWITGAYYSSAVGLKEIGWNGEFPHGMFAGCEHEAQEEHAKAHE
jgi:hypothetical protein